MKYIVVTLAALAAAAGVTYYVARPSAPKLPPVPPVPAEWTDRPMIEIVSDKRKAVEADPRNGAAWGQLGMAFDTHERLDEAMICYRTAMELDPTDARWPFLLAEQRNWRNRSQTDKEEAVRLYRTCLERKQPSPAHQAAAELSLADLLVELGRPAEAEPIYEQVYARDPSNPWAAYRVGVAAADRGDTARGIRVLMTLARNPYAQKKASAALAAIHRRLGHQKEADGFERASSMLPEDWTWENPFAEEVAEFQRGRHSLFETVNLYNTQGNFRAAADAARRLADLYPTPQSQLMLGRTLVNLTDYESAVPVLEDTLHGDPNMVMAHAFLGIAWYGLAQRADEAGRRTEAEADYAKATAALDKAVELKPDYAPGYFYKARILLRLHRPADALRAVRAGIDRRPEEWEGYVVLSEVLVATGDKAAAITALEQAVKLSNPNEVRPRQALEKLKQGK